MTEPTSMRTFYTIWIGQVISTIGSSLTSFALGVWVYESTGNATPLVLIALFGALPPVLFSAVAGAFVDRWNRRWVLIVSDTGAAVITLITLLLFAANALEVWHLYVLSFLGATFTAFQHPAFTASVTMMVPKDQLTRANGLTQTGQTVGGILAPVLAGLLFGVIGVTGIFVLDFVSFFFAVGALLLVRIPQPAPTESEAGEERSLLNDIRFGIRYLGERHGLLGLALFVALLNLIINSVVALSTPMILAFSNPTTMGVLQSVGSIGMFLGGLFISAWGGPRYKMGAMYIAAVFSGLGLAVAGLQPLAWLVGVGYFLFLFPIPTINSVIMAIVQLKIPANVQGRVFSLMVVLSRTGVVLGYLISGQVADRVFETAMAEGGSLAPLLGPIFGVGTGRGIGVMFTIAGFCMLLASALMYAMPALRNVERDLPDVTPEPVAP